MTWHKNAVSTCGLGQGLAVKSYEEDASKADVQAFFFKFMKKEDPWMQLCSGTTFKARGKVTPLWHVVDLAFMILYSELWFHGRSWVGACLHSFCSQELFVCWPKMVQHGQHGFIIVHEKWIATCRTSEIWGENIAMFQASSHGLGPSSSNRIEADRISSTASRFWCCSTYYVGYSPAVLQEASQKKAPSKQKLVPQDASGAAWYHNRSSNEV